MSKTPNDPADSPMEREYWCFISYRHADNKIQDRDWATWLHQEIERYEVPAELVGKVNKRGDEIPERIYPVFRDEESLPVDAYLAGSIETALDRSRFLTVLCSPRAVESIYVAEEISYFKKSGKGDRVIAAIVAGEPGDEKFECFPLPLRHPIGNNGELDTAVTEEPIAADFRLRSGEEGYTSVEAYRLKLKELPKKERTKLAADYEARLQLMKLKIIAGVIGVPLEELRDRDKAYQLQNAKKRVRNLARLSIAFALIATLAAIAGVVAFQQRKSAVSRADQLSLLLAADDAKAQLNSNPVGATESIIRIFDESRVEFSFTPSAVQNAVADAWKSGRAMRTAQVENLVPAISFDETGEKIVVEHAEVEWDADSPTLDRHHFYYHIKRDVFEDANKNTALESSKLSTNIHDVMGVPFPKSHDADMVAEVEGNYVKRIDASTLGIYADESFSSLVSTIKSLDGLNCWIVYKGARELIVTGGGTVGDAEGWDAYDSAIRFWDELGNQWGPSLVGHHAGIWDIALSPDLQQLGSIDESGKMIIWDLSQIEFPIKLGKREFYVAAGKTSVAVSPDETMVADLGSSGVMQIYELGVNPRLAHATESFNSISSGEIVALRNEDAILAQGDESVLLFSWDGEQIGAVEVGEKPYSLIENPSGGSLAWLTDSGVWNADEAGLKFAWEIPGMDHLHFLPGGNLLASRKEGTVVFWKGGTHLEMLAERHLDSPFELMAISGDGTRMATTGVDASSDSESREKVIRIWKVDNTRISLSKMNRISKRATCLRISPTNTELAVGFHDGSIQIWNLNEGSLIRELPKIHEEWVADIRFSPSGESLYSTSGDNTTAIYRGVSLTSQIEALKKRREF